MRIPNLVFALSSIALGASFVFEAEAHCYRYSGKFFKMLGKEVPQGLARAGKPAARPWTPDPALKAAREIRIDQVAKALGRQVDAGKAQEELEAAALLFEIPGPQAEAMLRAGLFPKDEAGKLLRLLKDRDTIGKEWVEKKLTIFDSLPGAADDEAIGKVFGEKFGDEGSFELRMAKSVLGRIDHKKQLANSPEEFKAWVAENKGNYAFLVGHNEGGNFKFLNGESMALEEMAKAAAENDVVCLVSTCRAGKFIKDGAVEEIDFDLTFAEGVAIIESAFNTLVSNSATAINAGKAPSPEIVKAAFGEACKNIAEERRKTVRLKWIGAGAGAGALALVTISTSGGGGGGGNGGGDGGDGGSDEGTDADAEPSDPTGAIPEGGDDDEESEDRPDPK